jgi:hypothetical protein
MHIYTEVCHKKIPCVAILNKQKFHFFFLSSAKSENRREEQVLSMCGGGDGLITVTGEGGVERV